MTFNETTVLYYLLTSNPSDRCQSSSGIIADLEKCVQQLKATATIAQHDVSGELLGTSMHICFTGVCEE